MASRAPGLQGPPLLYAQRLLTRGTDRRAGLWNGHSPLRWWAGMATPGRPRSGEEGRRSPGGGPGLGRADRRPLPVRLDKARAGGGEREARGLLRTFTLAFPLSTAAGLQAAKEVLLLQPFCFCAHDAMADYFGVSTQHVTNMIGPQARSNSSRSPTTT